MTFTWWPPLQGWANDLHLMTHFTRVSQWPSLDDPLYKGEPMTFTWWPTLQGEPMTFTQGPTSQESATDLHLMTPFTRVSWWPSLDNPLTRVGLWPSLDDPFYNTDRTIDFTHSSTLRKEKRIGWRTFNSNNSKKNSIPSAQQAPSYNEAK